MNLYFAENLKQLRNQKGLTQESLADFLGVSFQAVSKWERGENYPDIETLVNIAMFFEVNVDELLGVNRAENEEKILNIIEQCDNLTDGKLKHKIITDAIARFPTDFRLQLRQMADLAFGENGKDYKQNHPKVKAIYDNIQKNCTVDTIRICSKRYLAAYYNTLSYYEDSGITHKDCEKIIEQMPHMRDGKEFLSSYLYGPNHPDSKNNIQEALEEELSLLQHGITHFIHGFIDDNIPLNSRIYVAEFTRNLLEMFYDDGNYGVQWRHIIYLYGHLGHLYFQKGDIDKAVENLKKSAELAKHFDSMDRITIMHSKFFEGKEFDKHTLGSTYAASSHIKRLMTENYPLSGEFKQSPEFISIIQMLDEN